MKIEKAIEQLGYKRKEVKVYLAALGLGESTVSNIAQKAKMPRSSAQTTLDQLHRDGLANFYVKKRYKYWTAELPEKLLKTIKEKELVLSSAIKNFLTPLRFKQSRPSVKVFTGADDIRLIHEEMIQSKNRISAIIPWEEWSVLLGAEYLEDFIATRIKHFLDIRVLSPESAGSQIMKRGDQKELRHTKFIPESTKIEDALFIFGNKTAIISLNESMPTGVIIEDVATARMMKVFYEELWDRSRE